MLNPFPRISGRWVTLLILTVIIAGSPSRLALTQTTSTGQWSVGYYTPWGNPGCPISDIDMDALTHIVHWAAVVNADGTIDLNTQKASRDAPALISAAHAAGVKVLLGLIQTNWLGQTTSFQQAINTGRTVFVNNIMNVVNTYGYDGVDIDWEPFDALTNGTAMLSLAVDLRGRLGKNLLTADAIVTDYRYWGSIQEQLDRVNIMTYDLTGTWNYYSWHNAALYDTDGLVISVNRSVKQFLASGVPAAKLSIGIPFFGWQWTGGGITAPKQRWFSTPDLQQLYYQTFATTISQQISGWDPSARVPFLSGGNSFLTYDNEQSVTEKVNYAKENNLGGWIIWELSGDYLPAQAQKHPLLTAVKKAMKAPRPSQ